MPLPTEPFSKRLRFFGISESALAKRLDALSLPTHIEISYHDLFPEIEVQLASPDKEPDKEAVQQAHALILSSLGPSLCVSQDSSQSLVQVVHEQLQQVHCATQCTLALAESCTGGLLSALLCENPGASKYYLGGLVSYSNAAKHVFLDVPEELLARHGAVSPEVAQAMAAGAKARFQSTYALSVTGIAGPDGGSEEKPIGLVYIGLATPKGVQHIRLLYPQERRKLQRFAAFSALAFLRETLSSLP